MREIIVLATTALTIGFIHTLIGPDHYLPFIVLAKARKWTIFRTFMITFVCGLGHVLSSIILGFVGIVLGIAVFKLEAVEASRGDLASWLLISFGFAYFIWGIHTAIRNRPHQHLHLHEEGDEHLHVHAHTKEHSHIHVSEVKSLTPWIIFLIFVFGPCEPLIPLIMYPAAKHNMLAVTAVAFVFAIATISTMLGIVLASYYGLAKLPFQKLQRYSHAWPVLPSSPAAAL
jgi:sulfite exporter TauE/SafE